MVGRLWGKVLVFRKEGEHVKLSLRSKRNLKAVLRSLGGNGGHRRVFSREMVGLYVCKKDHLEASLWWMIRMRLGKRH